MYQILSLHNHSLKDALERDVREATVYRDDIRNEAKDWEKKFHLMQKERQRELSDTKRELREKQEMYGSIDTYLMRLNCQIKF